MNLLLGQSSLRVFNMDRRATVNITDTLQVIPSISMCECAVWNGVGEPSSKNVHPQEHSWIRTPRRTLCLTDQAEARKIPALRNAGMAY